MGCSCLGGSGLDLGAGTTFAPLQRVSVRAGSRAHMPRSARSPHRRGGLAVAPTRAQRRTQTQNLTLSTQVRSQKTPKGQGCFPATHGRSYTPHVFCVLPASHAGSPLPATMSVTPARCRWQPGDGLPGQPSPETGPASPGKRRWFCCGHRFYVCKRRAAALAAPGDKFRGTNPFPGFPEQTNELKGEQHHSALEEPPKTTFQLL